MEPSAKKSKQLEMNSVDAVQSAVNSILSEDLFEDRIEPNQKDFDGIVNDKSSFSLRDHSAESHNGTVEASRSMPSDMVCPKFYEPSISSGCSSKIGETGNNQEEKLSPCTIGTPVGTMCAIVADHYNRQEGIGLTERNKSRILHLRNFNNWMKSMLIEEYLTAIKKTKRQGTALKVLDIACGKGGDLFKWRQGNITHLICADIASTSVEQCKERYQDILQRAQRDRHLNPIFTAEFIVANCTKERLRKQFTDKSIGLDLVSCQFAFHYCFESLPQAECMMQNASECLKSGGYFIGTCPNANAIISRVRKSGGLKVGNDIYSVEFDNPLSNETPPPLFGAKYNFHMEGVVDCPEFLVHFPTFVRLADKYGLKCVACETFADYFDRMKAHGRVLLGKMQSLESYPPFPDQSLMGPLTEYKHADDFIQKTGTNRKLGTLSVSEWEAATLYLVFAFEKKKS